MERLKRVVDTVIKVRLVECDPYIIDTLNHDTSISDLLNPNDRIQKLVNKYTS